MWHDPIPVLLALLSIFGAAWVLLWLRRREIRRLQQTLVHEATRHAVVIESAFDAVISADHDRRIVVFNAAAERLFGCPRGDALGSPLTRFLPGDLIDSARESHSDPAATANGGPRAGDVREVMTQGPGGRDLCLEATVSTVVEPGSGGVRRLYTLVLRDVSERKRAETALREAQDALLQAQRMARLGHASYDVRRGTWALSPTLADVLGVPGNARLQAAQATDLVHPDDRAALQQQVERAVRQGRAYDHEFRIVRPSDGQVRWLHAVVQVQLDGAGAAAAMFGTVQDITERKLDLLALDRSREELRRVSASITRAREAERRSVARELHDELGQRLLALKLDLSALQLSSPAPGVDGLLKAVDGALAATRRLASDLRPAMLDDLGLGAALEWLTEQWGQRTGLQVHLDADTVDDRLGDDAATAIYRIVQEALTNAVRHARATTVHVTLREEPGELRLSVEDDGQGLAPGAMDKRESAGLAGIRERARLLGGRARVHNVAGGGCRVEVHLPLDPVGVVGPSDPTRGAGVGMGQAT